MRSLIDIKSIDIILKEVVDNEEVFKKNDVSLTIIK